MAGQEGKELRTIVEQRGRFTVYRTEERGREQSLPPRPPAPPPHPPRPPEPVDPRRRPDLGGDSRRRVRALFQEEVGFLEEDSPGPQRLQQREEPQQQRGREEPRQRRRPPRRRPEESACPMAFSFSTPTPVFQTPQQQQPQQQQTVFQQQSPFPAFSPQPQFQFLPQQQQQVQFQQQQQQQQQQAAPGAGAGSGQQPLLFLKDMSPAGYSTKFEDLHPDSQKFLFQIEERIREYRDESERLEQCSRLFDSSVSANTFELDANRIVQELGGISIAQDKEKASVQGLTDAVKTMIRDTEVAVRSYMMLRPRFLRQQITAASNQTTGMTGTPGQVNQLMTSSMAPVFDFYSGIPKRPSLFMHHTVDRFEKYLAECLKWVEELEQLVMMDADKTSPNSLESLPKVLSNVHDYFIHVAARVESLHQYIESMKTAYLADQRRRGDGNDPFLEANRREAAKQEAAARRVHPTLHLPAAQPTTQVAGIFSSSAAPVSSTPQAFTGTPASSSAGGFSIFSTPSSTPAASSSLLFSTPAASAPSSTLFGSSGFSPQSTLFGTASTSLFGSTQTPSGFGASTPSFASTPAISGSSLFSTPAGGASGSGASFGPSKSSRPRSRTTRR